MNAVFVGMNGGVVFEYRSSGPLDLVLVIRQSFPQISQTHVVCSCISLSGNYAGVIFIIIYSLSNDCGVFWSKQSTHLL